MIRYLLNRIPFRTYELYMRLICMFFFREFFNVKVKSTNQIIKFSGPYKRDILKKHPTVIHRCFGIYEPETSRALEKYINKNHVVLELGSAYGYFSIQIARLAKYVHCVEPNKSCLNYAKKNLIMNNLSNYKLYQDAIGNLIEVNLSDGTKIKSKTLNNFLKINNITPSFIFIDCDSADKIEHEFPILQMILDQFENIEILLETKNEIKLNNILKRYNKFKIKKITNRHFYIYTEKN